MRQLLHKLLLMAAMLAAPWVTQGQDTVSLPYSTTFDSVGQWQMVSGTQTNHWAIVDSMLTVTSNGTARGYNTGSTSFSYARLWVNIPTAGAYIVQYTWNGIGEGNYDYARMFLVPATATLTPGQTPGGGTSASGFGTTVPAGWLALDGAKRLNGSAASVSETSEINIATPGTYQVVVLWCNDGGGGTMPPTGIDNFSFAENPCPSPTNVAITAAATTATLTWSGSASSYVLEFADSAFVPGTGNGTVVPVWDTTYCFTDLTSDTYYYVYLRSVCGSAGNSVWIPYNIRTTCMPINSLPYSYGFEDGWDSCWTKLSTHNPNNPIISTTRYHTGTAALYMYASGSTVTAAILPPLDNTLYEDGVVMSFWMMRAYSNNLHNLRIGTIRNPEDASTFVAFDTVSFESNDTYEWENKVVAVPSTITAADGRLAIVSGGMGSTAYPYLDDVTLISAPSCAPIRDVTVENIHGGDVTLSWQYHDGYGLPEPFTYTYSYTDTLGVTVSDEVTDTNRITITDLSPGTTFTFRVWASCDDGSVGMMDSVVFTTDPACPPITSVTVNPSVNGAAIMWTYDEARAVMPPEGYTIVITDTAAGTIIATATSSTMSYLADNLTANTVYTVSVTPNCGSNGDGISDTTIFTTRDFGCGVYGLSDTAVIGSGTSVAYYPFTGNWYHRYYQQLYTSDEMNWTPGTPITSVAFHLGDYTDAYNHQRVRIYLDTVSITTMTGIVRDTATSMKVFDGPFNIPANSNGQWIEIPFDVQYDAYDTTKNLLMTVITDVTSYVSPRFYYTTGSGHVYQEYSDNYSYDAAGYYIGSTNTPSANTTLYRANTRFAGGVCQSIGTCAPPVVAIDSVSSYGNIGISWGPGANEVSYDVEWRSAGGSWLTLYSATGNTSAVLSNMTIGRTYEFRVTNDCGESTTLSYMFPCYPITRNQLPYLNDLEAESAGSGRYPTCWNMVIPNSSYGSYPYVYNTTYASSGRHALYFNARNTYANNILSLPQVTVSLDSLEVIFKMLTTSSTMPSMIVGVMTDPNDTATFEGVDTVTLSTPYVAEEFIVDLDGCHGMGQYIAFKPVGLTSYSYMYMDDIEVGFIPACRAARAIYPRHVGAEYIDMACLEQDSTINLGFEVKWDTVDNLSGAVDSMMSTTSSLTITGLQSLTTYYLWARTVCDAGTGRWTPLGAVTTAPPCMPVENIEVQYTAATNAVFVTWQAAGEGYDATAYIISYKNADSATWITDTVSTPYKLIGNVDTMATYQVTVTQLCDPFAADAVTVTFGTFNCATAYSGEAQHDQAPTTGWWDYNYCQTIYTANDLASVGDTIYGLYYLVDTAAVTDSHLFVVYMAETSLDAFSAENPYVPVDSLTIVNPGDTILTTMGSDYWLYVPLTTPFARTSHRNLVVAIDDNKKLVQPNSYNELLFAAKNTGDARTCAFYEDAIDVSPDTPLTAANVNLYSVSPLTRFNASCMTPSCMPAYVAVTYTDIDSAMVEWEPGLTETSWMVEYRMEGDSVWTVATAATTNHYCALPNLHPSVSYLVRVTSLCGATNAQQTVGFTTQCGPMALPFCENFDNESVGPFQRNCWVADIINDNYSGTASYYPYIYNYIGIGHVMRLYYGDYVILPEMAASDLRDLSVRLFANTTNTSTSGVSVIVGAVSDPGAFLTFLPVDTVTVFWGDLTHFESVNFANYPDSLGRIVLYNPSSSPIYIDNITVDYTPACGEVADDAISLTAVDTTTAAISWTGSAASYIVEYGQAGYNANNIGVTPTRLGVSGNSVNLTGLAEGTYYDVVIYSICNGDTSLGSTIFRFATECKGTVPYQEDFVVTGHGPSNSTGLLPPCWTYEMLGTGTYVNANYHPQSYYNTSTNYNTGDLYGLYLRGKAVTALPALDLQGASIDTLMLTFYRYASSNSYQLVVGVVDSLTPGFAASFTPVDTIDVLQGYDTVLFCHYTGNGQYIAFRNEYRTSGTVYYSNNYLDDIQVNYIPACMPLTYIVRDSSTQNSISFSWGGDCLHAASYIVEWGPAGFTQGTGTISTTTGSSMTQTGLSEATAYDVYVAPVCLNGDTGAWFFGTLTTRACSNPDTLYAYDTAAATTTTAYFPGNSYFRYGFTEVILDSADMAAAGFAAGNAVAGMAFLPTTTTAASYYDNCDIYMKNVALDHFTSSSDLVPMQPSDKVYSGNLNHATVDWVYREFDSPFVWDGSSNVVIAVDRNHGSYLREHTVAAITDTVARMLYNISDDYNHDPGSTTISSASTSRNRPILKLLGCMGPSCSAPVVTTITHDYQSAVINWNGTAENYELMVKAATASEWPAATTVNALTYALNGLQPATGYLYRLRSVCDVNLVSDWVEGTFTTDSLPCFAPSGLTATEGFGSAELSWTAGTDETQWRVHVWNTTFDSVYTANAKPYTATGLTPGTDYRAAVAAVCGGGLLVSDYSDTISIRTNTCDVPTGLATSNVTANSVHVTWNAGANNTGKWIVEYGVEGYVSGQGTEVTVTSASADLTGLESELTYDVYVRAVCDDAYPSGWSNKASFTTHGVGIDNVGASHVTLFPNPAANSTTVSVNGVEGMVTITVVDMNGRAVRTETVECSSDCTKTMDIDSLAAGAYFVRIQGGGINVVKKLVVK